MYEVYRGIAFGQTGAGVWVFHDYVPDMPGAYWTWFFTDDEISNTTADAMKRAIDRAYNKSPVT